MRRRVEQGRQRAVVPVRSHERHGRHDLHPARMGGIHDPRHCGRDPPVPSGVGADEASVGLRADAEVGDRREQVESERGERRRVELPMRQEAENLVRQAVRKRSARSGGGRLGDDERGGVLDDRASQRPRLSPVDAVSPPGRPCSGPSRSGWRGRASPAAWAEARCRQAVSPPRRASDRQPRPVPAARAATRPGGRRKGGYGGCRGMRGSLRRGVWPGSWPDLTGPYRSVTYRPMVPLVGERAPLA